MGSLGLGGGRALMNEKASHGVAGYRKYFSGFVGALLWHAYVFGIVALYPIFLSTKCNVTPRLDT